MLQLHEEGQNNLKSNDPVRFAKFFAKQQADMYVGYDHGVDMKKDPFLDSLSAEEKKKFRVEMVKIWGKEAKYSHDGYEKDNVWYMILQGKKANGESKVKLFQDEDVFNKERIQGVFGNWGWSLKACWFHDLEDAKNYIQMARDEEGVHWEWPQQIPAVWKTGPVLPSDILEWGTFPCKNGDVPSVWKSRRSVEE